MGKRRVQGGKQVRRQVRQVKPKLPAQATPAQQRRQRERYVQSGGMLQGYSPEFVERLGLYAAGAAVGCIVLGALIALVLPYGLPVKVAAGVAWIVPIVFLATFIIPGWRLARKDRRQEPRLVQGQLMGASSMSTSLGLGMLMVQTRGGTEQYLVEPAKLTKVPGNQVPVVLTVSPNLRYVRSVGVMGQRMVPRPEPPVPDVVKRLRVLPLATPAALALAAILGDDVTALLPIHPDVVHTAAAVVVGILLGLAVYGVSFLFQRRLYGEVQKLVPGGV